MDHEERKKTTMMIFVGDDWAEAHHDVHVMNESGDELVRGVWLKGSTVSAVYTS